MSNVYKHVLGRVYRHASRHCCMSKDGRGLAHGHIVMAYIVMAYIVIGRPRVRSETQRQHVSMNMFRHMSTHMSVHMSIHMSTHTSIDMS